MEETGIQTGVAASARGFCPKAFGGEQTLRSFTTAGWRAEGAEGLGIGSGVERLSDGAMKWVVVRRADEGRPEFESFLTVDVKHSKALCVFESMAAAEAFLLHAGIPGEGWRTIEQAPEDVAGLVERLTDWADMGYVVVNPLPRRFGPRSFNPPGGASSGERRKAVRPTQGDVETAWDFASFLRGR
ncbi:hypothetical protein [Rubrobacter marinus]|uniref:hypothetical protein n=1 Tax=Rubrobacter marinus TaxID=2653852 RepID=UPI001408AF6E|nr:hypothetical protein [Rubrobacter marinus]